MRPRRVLIVEDDSTDRELLKSSLREHRSVSYEFAEEPTGSNALRRFDEFRPDCVLLDLNLPDMSGLDVLASLSRREENPAVVVITAFGSEQIAVAAMKNGAADYVVKNTLTPENLIHSIENAIEKQQLRLQVDEQRRALEERNVELQRALAREKENQERYRMLTEAIPQVVWTATHPDGQFDHVSPRWVECTGLPIESALGSAWLDAVHPDDRDRVAQSWRNALKRREQFEVECRLGAAEGGYRWNLARAIPQFENDSVLRWFGTFTDIEDRRRAEQAMLQRQKLESTGLLAGGIAHDFNNLLVGILGGISYALETLPESDESRPILENAMLASERAALLVRQMLAYAGKGKFVIEQVDLPQIVRSTCNLVAATIPKMVHLNVQTAHDTPVIEGDPSQIQQIVMNLIINAAEAIGDEEPGVVTVRTGKEILEREDPDAEIAPGTYAFLEVVDTGRGMNELIQTRIFEPFFTTKFTGRGLGLAAVMGIVRSAKGSIRVQSSPGKGATFRVLLPAKATAAAIAQAAAPLEPRSVFASILVIDDEDIVRRTATAALERGGYNVRVAAGGMEALAVMRQNPGLFDLVLLDLNMPDLSGEETLRQMHAINPSVRVVVFSGYSESEVLQRLGDQPVAGILPKPFTSQSLLEKVAAFLPARPAHA